MNIKDLKDSLDYMFKAQVTPFMWGHAGIGKSTVVRQYAKDKGYKFFPFYLGTQSDIGDILGLASFVRDENGTEVATTFATPLWLKETIDYCNANPDSGAVILLDEFNRARKDILSGMFSLALDKTFHMIKLPSNCHIIAAGNPPTDDYFVTDIGDTALMARFVHIKLEPTFNEWVEYANATQLEPTLVGFLQEQPGLLEETRNSFNLPVKVDRRAYERASKLFKVGTPTHLLDQLLAGVIGIERLVAYKQYLQSAEKPLTGEQVLSGKHLALVKRWSDPTNIKAALLNTTCDNLFSHLVALPAVDPREMESLPAAAALVEFLETLPIEVAYPFVVKCFYKELRWFSNLFKTAFEPRLHEIVREAKGKKLDAK